MAVERVLFASGERADCRGRTVRDARRGMGVSGTSGWILSELQRGEDSRIVDSG